MENGKFIETYIKNKDERDYIRKEAQEYLEMKEMWDSIFGNYRIKTKLI